MASLSAFNYGVEDVELLPPSYWPVSSMRIGTLMSFILASVSCDRRIGTAAEEKYHSALHVVLLFAALQERGSDDGASVCLVGACPSTVQLQGADTLWGRRLVTNGR